MRQLLLLRHAKSAWGEPGCRDHSRRLDAQGLTAAAAMAATLSELPPPDMVLVSTARRTRETLDALGAWPALAITEPRDGLYLASATELLEQIRSVPDRIVRLLIIGHNPGLHDLALDLTQGTQQEMMRTGFPTGAFAEFAVPESWTKLGLVAIELARFLRPPDRDPDT